MKRMLVSALVAASVIAVQPVGGSSAQDQTPAPGTVEVATTTTTTAPPDNCYDSTGVAHGVGGNHGLGECLARERKGWVGAEFRCLSELWGRLESSWNQHADNPRSSAHGIPQALPGSKMGPGWRYDVRVQIVWGLDYVSGRYGTPCKARSFRLKRGWY